MGNKLLVFAGRPGAGKSTLADMMGAAHGFVRLDKDDPSFKSNDLIRRRLEEYRDSGVDFWETPECKQVLEPALYREVFERAHLMLSQGKNCVVDGPLLKEAEDPAYRTFIEEIVNTGGVNAEIFFFWFTTSPEQLKKNIFGRNAERDYAKMEQWADYIAAIDFDFRPVFPHILIDTTSRTPQDLQAFVEAKAGLKVIAPASDPGRKL